MSEIVKLQNGLYEFKIPPPPQREEDILFIKEKKKDQYWRTPDIPMLSKMSIRDRVKYIDRDRERWLNGVHFMNNGELTYITGMHYDHLTHMTFRGKKAFYLDHQRLDFYFRELSWLAPKCKGRVIAKGRRVGASMEEITEATYRSMEDSHRMVALISTEERKTKKTLFNPLVDSYIKRLKHMRATYYKPNGKKPKQELKLSNDDIEPDDDSVLDILLLNSIITPFPTSVSALDGFLGHYCTADESWKWAAASPLEFLETSLPCFDDGGEKIGIISMLSTLGDTDDVKAAIDDGIFIYQNSDIKNLTPEGFTQTGLWKWFISAVYAERKLKNIYGKINVDQATEKILNERKKYPEGSQKWVHEVRRHPLTEEEAMATANGTTTFDNARLQDRITFIVKLPIAEKPYILGELHEDTTKNKIHFEPTNNGNWQIAIHPQKSLLDNVDRSNRCFQDSDGKWHLNKSPEGCFGYDPVRFGDKQTTATTLSKSAIIGRYKWDYFDNKDKFGRSCAGRYCAMYHYRDEDPELSHFEFLKAMRYYGFKGTYERNVGGVYDKMKEWQAFTFLTKHSGAFGLLTDNQKRVIKKGIDKFQSLIKRPKAGSDDVDRLKDIPFEELLVQAKELDPLKTQKSDIFMANTMMEHGLELITYADIVDEMLELIGENENALFALFGH